MGVYDSTIVYIMYSNILKVYVLWLHTKQLSRVYNHHNIYMHLLFLSNSNNQVYIIIYLIKTKDHLFYIS